MDPEVWWIFSLTLGGIVIVFIAVMLGLILAAAKSIDGHARQIWSTGKQIAGNTVTIWILESVKERLEMIQDSSKKLGESANSINESLRKLGGKPNP